MGSIYPIAHEEEVVREIAAFKQLCEDNGVSMQKVSTALANNPAVLEDQDSSRSISREILDALDQLQEKI